MIKIQTALIRCSQVAWVNSGEDSCGNALSHWIELGTTGGTITFHYSTEKSRNADLETIRRTMDEGYGDALA